MYSVWNGTPPLGLGFDPEAELPFVHLPIRPPLALAAARRHILANATRGCASRLRPDRIIELRQGSACALRARESAPSGGATRTWSSGRQATGITAAFWSCICWRVAAMTSASSAPPCSVSGGVGAGPQTGQVADRFTRTHTLCGAYWWSIPSKTCGKKSQFAAVAIRPRVRFSARSWPRGRPAGLSGPASSPSATEDATLVTRWIDGPRAASPTRRPPRP